MTIDFHPEAQNEILALIKYYNQKAAGLGDQFYDEVLTALALLRSFPEIGNPFQNLSANFHSIVFLLPLFISTKKKAITGNLRCHAPESKTKLLDFSEVIGGHNPLLDYPNKKLFTLVV